VIIRARGGVVAQHGSECVCREVGQP
jgi:hypothetical protein